MFESLPVIAAIFIILWLACLVVYLRYSAGQEDLADEIEALQARLEAEGDDASR